MKNLIKKFQNISHQYNLWRKGDKIVVACSGGPDSTCLLDIFVKLQKKYGLELIVAHVNYGLRGKDSDKDAVFVKKLAALYLLRFIELKPKIKDKSNLEKRLREIRYDFFEKIRRDNKFDYIAVGHTLDDQVETFLMRIIRGSGLAGMAAMRHKNNFVIRPLLGITKKEILKYLKSNKLSYQTDKTNKEVPYFRNKIRNEVIPLLEKKYNPNIKETLYVSSLSIADDYDFLEQISRETYKKNKKLNAKNILKLHPAMQKRVILEAIKNKKGDLKDVESANIEEILKVLKSGKSKSQIIVFKGLKFMRKGDKMILSLND
jgi:tRNA(Ile)-lysidine synthase